MTKVAQSDWRTPAIIIIAGCLISMIGFGSRSTFGLYLDPVTELRGWSRETFSLALAIQNLMWGLCLPIAGALADRFGASKVILAGALIYAIGIYGMSAAESASMFHLLAGVVTGTGVAFTAFSLAMAAMAKVVGTAKRSMVLGLGTAAGSFGQVLFSPISQGFISAFGWQQALVLQAAIVLLLLPLAVLLPATGVAKKGADADDDQSLRAALQKLSLTEVLYC